MADSIIYPGLVHLNGCLMAAVDLETTGTRPGWHEIIQIAVVPLDSDFKVLEGVRPFYTHVKPKYPERESEAARQKHKIPMDQLLLHAPESDRVADWLMEWFEGLRLPFKKCLIPLAHNWAFESSFLKAWLGVEQTDYIFHSHARDGMLYAVALNDKAAFAGDPQPFPRVSLGAMCATSWASSIRIPTTPWPTASPRRKCTTRYCGCFEETPMGQLWTADKWRDIITRVNNLAVNPTAGCTAVAPLDVWFSYRWSVAEITAVRNKLTEICATNSFSAPTVKWTEAIVAEIEAAIARGWCGCAAWTGPYEIPFTPSYRTFEGRTVQWSSGSGQYQVDSVRTYLPCSDTFWWGNGFVVGPAGITGRFARIRWSSVTHDYWTDAIYPASYDLGPYTVGEDGKLQMPGVINLASSGSYEGDGQVWVETDTYPNWPEGIPTTWGQGIIGTASNSRLYIDRTP